MRVTLVCLLGLWWVLGFGQRERKSLWQEKLDDYNIKFTVGVQFWTTYTMGQEVYDPTDGRYETVENRITTELHRSRLAISGQPYRQLKFNLTSSLDFVGRDLLSGTQGGANNGPSPSFRIWNAYLQWNLVPKMDILHVTVAYMPPQIGRESISPALRVTSMDKAWSQNYLRRQLVGTGPGRSAGVNIGGLTYEEGRMLNFSYDIGVFNPVFHSFLGNSMGAKATPLITARAVLHFGDPETENYSIGHKINYFGRRKGVSIAAAGAYQGETEIFDQNTALSLDLLWNWSSFNLDGEWNFLKRNRGDLEAPSGVGHLRASYNFMLPKEKILELVLMYSTFRGSLEESDQREANRLGAFAGEDSTTSLGLNFYFNPDLKLTINYSRRKADEGDANPGVTFNNYFFQNGVGAIKRGNWIGLGVVGIF